MSELDEIINTCNELIEREPNNANVYFNRGMTYFKSGQFTAAISDFSRVIELTPTPTPVKANAYCFRGMSFFHKDKFDLEVEDIEAALKIQPDNTQFKELLEQAKELKKLHETTQ